MNINSLVRFDRRFQIWLYSVSHGQLLLRSTKGSDHQTQVDILFKDVDLILLPTAFFGLSILERDLEELKSLNLLAGLLPIEENRYFKLKGDNWEGVIVAGNVIWLEDDSEYFMDSKLMPPYK